jgi:hypothetical protein
VVEVGQERDLGAEVEKATLGHGARILTEPLHHDVDSLPPASMDHGPQGLPHIDVVRGQYPPAGIGRRQPDLFIVVVGSGPHDAALAECRLGAMIAVVKAAAAVVVLAARAALVMVSPPAPPVHVHAYTLPVSTLGRLVPRSFALFEVLTAVVAVSLAMVAAAASVVQRRAALEPRDQVLVQSRTWRQIGDVEGSQAFDDGLILGGRWGKVERLQRGLAEDDVAA